MARRTRTRPATTKVLLLLALVAAVTAQTYGSYEQPGDNTNPGNGGTNPGTPSNPGNGGTTPGNCPTCPPGGKTGQVCEDPLTEHHPGSKQLGTWPEYKGANQKTRDGCRPKKNFIFMVSDGFGTASETIAREYYQYKQLGTNEAALADVDSILPLDTLLVGAVRTKSSDSWITDSASAATAYACGIKTFNAGIAVDPKNRPCATVLEAAKAAGYTTALVATSRITHATPAGWSAHVIERDWEDIIAAQQIGDNVLGRSVDLMFGGGRKFFIPKSKSGSGRNDERDLFVEAKEKYGWKSIVQSRAEFLKLTGTKADLPAMGIFASSHMAYTIDRNATAEPSLAEMTQTALSTLADATSDCDSPGFFIMIEGSRIDHAGHTNDVAAHVHDILAYQEAVSIVKSFTKANPGTVALSVSDHETGGVTVASQPDLTKDSGSFYKWNPWILDGVKASIESFDTTVAKYNGTDFKGFITKLIAEKQGIKDLTDAEIQLLAKAVTDQQKKTYPGTDQVDWALSTLIAKRALVGFTTHGHTGMDVNLYAINAPGLRGNMDNTQLAHYSAEYLGVTDVQKKLNERVARQKVTLRKRGEFVNEEVKHHKH
ncbi:hypothetical protein GGF31_000280 [Allomyces arbusculus]|nr:hypothetical protein GGF31_000280 [Allomyces arbusculus]